MPEVLMPAELADYLRVSMSGLDLLCKLDNFPKPIRIGNGPKARRRWLRKDVMAYLERQSAGKEV